MWFVIISIFFSCFSLAVTYLYFSKVFNYWKDRRVPCVEPTSFIFGNIEDIFFCKKNVGVFYKEIYRKFSDCPYVGFYEFHKPVLLLRDPELIKTVLVKYFNNFYNKKAKTSKHDTFYGLNPAALKGERWKKIRTIMIPAFTNSKLRTLSNIIFKEQKQIMEYIDKNPVDVEAFEFASRFTCNTVSSYGWGIDGNAFCESKPLMKTMFDRMSSIMNIYYMKMLLHPLLAQLYNLMYIPKQIINFFINITRQSVKRSKGAKGNTNLAGLIGTILETDTKLNLIENMKYIEYRVLGHLLTFFVDAYETTAWGFSSIFYFLIRHPEIQQMLRQEIINNIKKGCGEEINIDDVKNLKYLNMFITEVLRLCPPFPYLDRVCTERCQLGKLIIEPGTALIIPTLAIHHDPEYYSKPEVFEPENFSDEREKERHPFTYLPFGQGPRQCTGMKFALVEMKLLLCYLLKNYELIPSEKHKLTESMSPNNESPLLYIPDHNLYMTFKKLI